MKPPVAQSVLPWEGTRPDPRKTLERKFGWPPFTVLDSASGPWQDRKDAWLGIGIKSELGRDAALMDDSKSSIYNGNSEWLGYRGAKTESAEKGETSSTSVFDPVLAELLYGWFCPQGGHILDPFAGGSVRGIVAAILGYDYTGIDLSQAQVTANEEQGATIIEGAAGSARWICGDSTKAETYPDDRYDMVMTCPPYGDLEVYSDDLADISNKPYPEFLSGLRAAITLACGRLKANRFAAIVVGDFRDKSGNLRGFPGSMPEIFGNAGLSYYNSSVLVTSRGSLPARTSYLFPRGRKLGRCHQEILGFLKGDWHEAAAAARSPEETASMLKAEAEAAAKRASA